MTRQSFLRGWKDRLAPAAATLPGYGFNAVSSTMRPIWIGAGLGWPCVIDRPEAMEPAAEREEEWRSEGCPEPRRYPVTQETTGHGAETQKGHSISAQQSDLAATLP
jgi:hypothetical protein